MASTEEVRLEILEPMRALFRVPFGIEDPETALAQYAKALVRFSVEAIRGGWSRVVESHKKRDWPPIGDLLDAVRIAESSKVVPVQFRRADGDQDQMNHARIYPAGEMAGFYFRKADNLRRNPTWARFLDSIHPTAEHCFFSQAIMGATANELGGLTKFEAQYIWAHWGEQLKSSFGGSVYLNATRAV